MPILFAPKTLLSFLILCLVTACASGGQTPLKKEFTVEELLGPKIQENAESRAKLNLVVKKPEPYEITLTSNSIWVEDYTHSYDAAITEATRTGLSKSFVLSGNQNDPLVIVEYNDLDTSISCWSGKCSTRVSFKALLTIVVPGRKPVVAEYKGDGSAGCQGTWGCQVYDEIHPRSVKLAFAELMNLISLAINTEIEFPS